VTRFGDRVPAPSGAPARPVHAHARGRDQF